MTDERKCDALCWALYIGISVAAFTAALFLPCPRCGMCSCRDSDSNDTKGKDGS